MKNIYLLILAVILSGSVNAQEKVKEEKKDPVVSFSGHIRYEAFYDSYAAVYTREGDIYLYPQRANINASGDDINDYSQLNMLSAQSRLRAKINGPEAFGAKVSGLVEVDFLGRAGAPTDAAGNKIEFTQGPRIRHMMMSLKWEKANLIMGQHWHPIFATECFPSVLSMGAALPFNPLNRAPQIKLVYNLTDALVVEGAALSHLDMASKGPATAQKYAVTPDFHFSLKYKTKSFAAGVIGGYKVLKPRLTTASGNVTEQTIGSYDFSGFAKINAGDLTVKAYGIYGENLSSYVMIGGYGAAEDITTVDDYTYSNINTMSVWGEVSYKLGMVNVGLFGGYSANLGTSEDNYYELGYTRSGSIDNILRISPRAAVTSGKVTLGLEYMMTSAVYVDRATAGVYDVTSTDDAVSNNRIYFMAQYKF